MGLRSRFVRWLMDPEVRREIQRELEKIHAVKLQKEVNILRNEKLYLINLLRKNCVKIPKKFEAGQL